MVAQTARNLPATQETQVQSLGQEDPLEKGIAAHSIILAWRIPFSRWWTHFIDWPAPWNSYDYPHHGVKPLRGTKGARLCSYWGGQGWTWPLFSLRLTCCSVDSTVVVSSYLVTVACAAMMKPITQESGSSLASPARCGLADCRKALSCLLSQIGWVWILWRWQGALSKNCPGLISSPTWPVAFSLSLYPGYLSFPAGHETSQRQGKSSWWSGHNPPRGGQGEEFTTTLMLRFGRQMTSVSDKWE